MNKVLNILIILISQIVLQVLIHHEYGQCLTKKNCFLYHHKDEENNLLDNILQQKKDIYNNHVDCYSNRNNRNTINNIQNKLSPVNNLYKTKIQLQNDSFNALYMLYQNKTYQKVIVPFVQLGIQNLLSEKIINFGLGKRYAYNYQQGIGYNIFYCFKIFNNIDNMNIINVGGEFWSNYIKFTTQGYYNLNDLSYYEIPYERLQIARYPKIGYQLCAQSEVPYFSKFIGKIKWEHFFYDNKNQYTNYFDHANTKNNKFSLSFILNYKPIPILDFDLINKFGFSKNESVLKMSINYQFNVPIAQQINHHLNNYYKYNDIEINHLYSIIPIFLPSKTILNKNIHYFENELEDLEEITGYPGEIKIIKINYKKNAIHWENQELKNISKIFLLKKNMYMIRLSNALKPKEKKCVISYSYQQDDCKNKKENIVICMKNFSERNYSNVLLQNDNIQDSSVIYTENQSYCINDVDTHTDFNASYNQNDNVNGIEKKLFQDLDSTAICYKHKKNENNDHLIVQTQKEAHEILSLDNNKIPKTDNNNSANSCIPIPPPLPSYVIKEKELLPPSYFDISCHNVDSNQTQKTLHHFKENQKTDFPDSELNTNKNDHPILLKKLTMSKKYKFSSISAPEYVDQLEKNIMARKKERHFSEIEQMLIKLNLKSQSSSSSLDYENNQTKLSSNNSSTSVFSSQD